MVDMKKIAIWGDSVLKGVVLEEGKDRYSLLKDSSIELIKREYNLMIKNNSKFGLTVTKAMKLMDKSLSKGDHPNYVLVELGGNDCDYNWKEISENPDKVHLPNHQVVSRCQYIFSHYTVQLSYLYLYIHSSYDNHQKPFHTFLILLRLQSHLFRKI